MDTSTPTLKSKVPLRFLFYSLGGPPEYLNLSAFASEYAPGKLLRTRPAAKVTPRHCSLRRRCRL